MSTSKARQAIPPAAVIVLLGGVLFTFALFLLLLHYEAEERVHDLQQEAAGLLWGMQRQIDVAVELVDSVGALYDASDEVTRDEFRRFVAAQLDRHAEVQALLWLPRVAEPDQAGYRARARADGLGDYAIAPFDAEAAAMAQELFPAYFVEPLAGNSDLLGRDFASLTPLRAALERARDSGAMVASPILALGADAAAPRAYLIVRPVYRHLGVPPDAVGRHTLLLGHVAGVFRIGEQMGALARGAAERRITFALFDGDSGQRLYQSSLPGTGEAAWSWAGEIHLPGRSWQAVFHPTAEFLQRGSAAPAWLVLTLSLLFVLLLSYHLLSASRRARRLVRVNQALAASREQIAQAHREWMDAFDAVSDPIFLHDGEGRVMRANRAYTACAGRALDDVLGQFYWRVFPRSDSRPAACLTAQTATAAVEEEEVHADGRTYAARYFAIRDGRGGYRYSLHILRDVTAQRAAERRLADEQARAQRYLEVAAVIMLALDRDGNIRLINPRGCEILGYPEAELRGRSWVDNFVAPRDRDAARQAFAAHLAGRAQSYNETWVLGRSGEQRLIAWHNTLLHEADGTVSGTLSSGMDITERHRLEQALRESQHRLQTLFDTASDGILVADLATRRFVLVNRAMADLLGYSVAELHWLGVDDIHPADQLAQVHDQFARQARGEVTLVADTPLRRRDGSLLYADISASPVELDGRPCLLGIFRDTSERRRMEAALRAREEQLALALQAGNDGLWDWDVARNTVYYSPRWKALLGLGEEALGDGYEEWQRWVHPEDLPRVLADIRAVLAGAGDQLQIEFRMRHRDGRWLWILSRSYVVRDAAGRAQRLVGTNEDITARREAEERARGLARQLRERLKESECLYRVAQLLEEAAPLPQLLQRAVELLPAAWQYPESASARLRYLEREYVSAAFREGPWQQTADIVTHGVVAGSVAVFYDAVHDPESEGPFLREERALLEAVADQLGQLIVSHQAQQTLQRTNRVWRLLHRAQRDAGAPGLVQEICQALVDEAEGRLVWIGCRDASGQWHTVAAAGSYDDRAEAGAPWVVDLASAALEHGLPQRPAAAEDAEQAQRIALPLSRGGETVGILVVGTTPAAPLADAELELLRAVAEDLADGVAAQGRHAARARA